jgi:photosystem II stability/assembly factor-like uncharacterized protein
MSWIRRNALRAVLFSTVILGLSLLATAIGHGVWAQQPAPHQSLFQGLRYRSIGPARGGRVTAVAGHRREPQTYYMGATGGGVWKTTDAGQNWANISDGYFETSSIGAIAVADSDPNVIYVGTGSAAIRSNVIRGLGVWRSTDGGKTWRNVGLRGAGQIGAIRIHPRQPLIAYVAVLGQPFGPSDERGVFRTMDGGETWQKVLFIDPQTGVVSLAMNPANPEEIYAGVWQAERRPWTILSGGPATKTGIYKTTNGGNTWTHLTKGLPTGLIGKVDVDLCYTAPQHIYAILEADGSGSGVYRSTDSGASWQVVSKAAGLVSRPFYYTYIDVDPRDPEVVWVNNLSLWRSGDGGKSFRTVPTPHGDNHGMWINPDDPKLMIQSNDGGANVSLNGGATWSTIYNQPTAEIYQLAVDNQFPYRLYGAQQDNTTLIVPSLPPMVDRVDDPMQLWMTGPGCETGPIVPNPLNPKVIYGACKGEFYRMNLETGQTASYWVHPQNRYGHNPADIKYRFQRVSPLEVSPHNPRVIYHASHVVHRTMDEGVTWEVISPDLTANEPDKQVLSGGPITRDITGEEVYSTIYAFRESTLEPGVLWAGANDGPVHVSRDNGRTWKKVTPAGLPPGGRVQNIEPSPHRKGSAYLAIYRYLLDDWQPYIYLTNDYGATWRRLTDGKNGIPADCPTRVVREDPDRQGLLYAGTEYGIFVSFDQGGQWKPLQLNLPVTPVTDLRVHQKDLVVATMGRSFWILDDLTPLQQMKEPAGAPALLLAPRAALRTRHPAMGGRGSNAAEPEYPPPGARIDYYLNEDVAGELKLEILDGGGALVRSYVSRSAGAGPRAEQGMRGPVSGVAVQGGLTTYRGQNRFVWDLRHGELGGPSGGRELPGPLVLPGRYTVRLAAGKWSLTQPLEVKLDPRLAKDGVTPLDLRGQFDLIQKVRAASRDARTLVQRIDREIGSAPAARQAELKRLREQLVTATGPYPQPMLIDQLTSIYRMISDADRKVGRSAIDYYSELRNELDRLSVKISGNSSVK